MKNITKLLLASAIALFMGCDGDAGTTAVVKTNDSVFMATTYFDVNTGAVTKDVNISSETTGTTMFILDGTVLRDKDSNNTIKEVPKAEIAVEKSKSSAKTTIDFTTSDGNRVIPLGFVVISIPAPAGAKPGDTVQINVPDDDSITITEKLIFVIVKADGTVDIRVFSKAFEKTIVIIVEIEVQVDDSTN
jgi:hypothetical protein